MPTSSFGWGSDMPRTARPQTVICAARNLIAAGEQHRQHADQIVIRTLIDRLAAHRGLLAPDWPPMSTPVDSATLAKARTELADLDMTGWEIVDIAAAYEHLLGRADAWFTPPQVAEAMVQFSLAPQLDRLSRHPDPGNILQVQAIDPSCGGGVFLTAAASFIATRYAQRLFGEATDLTLSIVLPEVLSETIFGIDIDPVAVDISKAALWFLIGGEQPITFMDHNIICADPLAGPHVQPPKLAEDKAVHS